MIPKIIHHTAPTNTNKWHPIWNRCLDSWKRWFPEPEYQHFMWNDEDIDNLIQNSYPEYWNLYQSFACHIIKIDFSRHAILHMHGGIYADMDLFCYKNFYDELDSDTVMLEALAIDEILQNSMMASNKDNGFMLYCMDECVRNFYQYDERLGINHYVKDICGPYHTSRCYKRYPRPIKVLEGAKFNPPLDKYDESFVTKHMLTGLWGKESIDLINNEVRPDESYADFVKVRYLQNRGVDLNTYNFYKNY